MYEYESSDMPVVPAKPPNNAASAVAEAVEAPPRPLPATDPDAWVDTDYTDDGEAQISETTDKVRRLIVRRTRLTDLRHAKLWPDWRHFAFLTDLAGDTVEVGVLHRQHAIVELAIRDMRHGARLRGGSATKRTNTDRLLGPTGRSMQWPRRPADRGCRRPRVLSAETKWEIFLQITTGKITEAEAARKWTVDVSTIIGIRKTVKDAALLR
jgi:hypothetical protein